MAMPPKTLDRTVTTILVINTQRQAIHMTKTTTLDSHPAEVNKATTIGTPAHVITNPEFRNGSSYQLQLKMTKIGMMTTNRLVQKLLMLLTLLPLGLNWEATQLKKQISWRSTAYADLQTSLMTLEHEEELLQNRAQVSYYTRDTTEYQTLPPPPAPTASPPGYEKYMHEQQTWEQQYHEDQLRKQTAWEQCENQYQVTSSGFAIDEPQPTDNVL